MLNVKIEFCPFDWYSSSPTAIFLYKRMYMCKVFPSNCQKLKKKMCVEFLILFKEQTIKLFYLD